MRSPTGVAVPWASINPTDAGSSPLARHACSTASTWPAGAGLEAGAAAVARHAGAADHGVGAVAVALGVGQALEHEDAGALPHQDAGGRLAEGADGAGGRESAELAEHAPEREVVAVVDPAGEHQVGAARAELVDGLVDGDQRARAGGVDGVGRTAEVEAVGDARRRQVGHEPDRALGPLGSEALLELRLHLGEAVLVDARHQRPQGLHELLGGAHPLVQPGHAVADVAAPPEDHPDPARVHPLVGRTGIVEGGCRGAERQELVGLGGVHGHRHDPEGQWIERGQVVHEAAPAAVEAIGALAVGVEEDRVPPVRRHVGGGVHPLADVVPERLDGPGAREQARQAHDGDAVVVRGGAVSAHGAGPQSLAV
ncbi:MAG: hypothetical protein R2746_18130 [Acidimicrobiales bacterium]